MSEWQPIETVPQDGRRVLGWGENGYALIWVEGGKLQGISQSRRARSRVFYWQPLPAPPQPEPQEGGGW